jgi:hypothetical protein
MSEYTHVSPGKMAFYFFSSRVISRDKYMEVKKASTSPDSDTEDINMDLLMTVYDSLLVNPSMIDAVHSALEKLKKQKLVKDLDLLCEFNNFMMEWTLGILLIVLYR